MTPELASPAPEAGTYVDESRQLSRVDIRILHTSSHCAVVTEPIDFSHDKDRSDL